MKEDMEKALEVEQEEKNQAKSKKPVDPKKPMDSPSPSMNVNENKE